MSSLAVTVLQSFGEFEPSEIDIAVNLGGGAVSTALTTLLVGAVLVALAPEYTQRKMVAVRENVVTSFIYGLASLVFLILVIIVLFFTLIGIPLALLLGLLVFVAWVFGAAIAFLAIADSLVGHDDGWLVPLLVAAAINGGLTLTGSGRWSRSASEQPASASCCVTTWGSGFRRLPRRRPPPRHRIPPRSGGRSAWSATPPGSATRPVVVCRRNGLVHPAVRASDGTRNAVRSAGTDCAGPGRGRFGGRRAVSRAAEPRDTDVVLPAGRWRESPECDAGSGIATASCCRVKGAAPESRERAI